MAGVQPTKTTFVNNRKQTLSAVQYMPVATKPVAKIFFHHGCGEHIGRYVPVFKMMAEKGCAVFGYDAYSQGLSEPKEEHDRCVLYSIDDLVADFYQYVDIIKASYPDLASLPTFAAGHSLGGLVGCHAVLRNQGMWAGLILHSPAIDVEWNMSLRMQAPISGILGWLVPRLRMVPAVRTEDMSQDPKVIEAYLADPLIFHGPLPIRTGSMGLQAFRSLAPRYSEFTLPMYAAHGTIDRCTSLSATQRLMAAANSKDKTFREVQGGYHELLHGPEAEECTLRIIDWVLARAAPRTNL